MPMLTIIFCYLEPPKWDWISTDTYSQLKITKLSARFGSSAIIQEARSDNSPLLT